MKVKINLKYQFQTKILNSSKKCLHQKCDECRQMPMYCPICDDAIYHVEQSSNLIRDIFKQYNEIKQYLNTNHQELIDYARQLNILSKHLDRIKHRSI